MDQLLGRDSKLVSTANRVGQDGAAKVRTSCGLAYPETVAAQGFVRLYWRTWFRVRRLYFPYPQATNFVVGTTDRERARWRCAWRAPAIWRTQVWRRPLPVWWPRAWPTSLYSRLRIPSPAERRPGVTREVAEQHDAPAHAALRNYIVDLHQQVLDLVRAGQSWDELYRNVKFSDEVQHWTAFSTMKTLNVLGMYRWVTNHRRGEW